MLEVALQLQPANTVLPWRADVPPLRASPAC